MRQGLLELLACPVCAGRLILRDETAGPEEVWTGELRCAGCDATFPVRWGMPHLYVDDEKWAPKAREAEGWAAFHKNRGAYEQPEHAIDLQIPYYPEEPWISVARSFDIALEELALVGDEHVLDLGAGRGWAAKHFALRGCEVVALDIVADLNIGLGRGHALMQDAGVHFDRLIADGESLPLQEGTFDLVFCAGTLHHSSDLPLLLRNIWRILAPGGLLCAINEPCISVVRDEQELLRRYAREELDLGINETRPTVAGYYDALLSSGFTIRQLVPAQSYAMNDVELAMWSRDVGARLGWPRFSEPSRSLWQSYNYARARWQALTRQRRMRFPVPAALSGRQRLAYEILLWTDQEVIILAGKPADKNLAVSPRAL
jgi:SAM-dependent methyltransferase